MDRYMRYMRLVLQAVCLTWLFSCVQEDGTEYSEGGQEEVEMKTVTLQVGALGSMQTRIYGEDEAAVAGEFMNSLRLYIVDNRGVVEKAINATADEDFEPRDGEQGGCAISYTTEVTLRTGAKTIYAFANMEGHNVVGGSTVESVLDGIKEGGDWPEELVEKCVVDDPASKINLTDVFIPMTVKQDVSIPVASEHILIELVRLVGKIRPVLNNDKGNPLKVTTLSIGNFADRVSLFENGDAGDVKFDCIREYDLELNETVGSESVNLYGKGVLITKEGKQQSAPEIYVNETKGQEPFLITLTINEESMEGKTVSKVVPRNHYLPLALNLSELQLVVTAYVAPIGGYPVAVTIEPSLTNNYSVTLPEGCTFRIEGTFGAAKGLCEWMWTVPTDQNLVRVTDVESNPLEGWLSARSGQTVVLNFSIAEPRKEEGSLTIITEALKDWKEYGVNNRCTVDWRANRSVYEVVNLGRM